MSGPAGLDMYSSCIDISALVVTSARNVIVPGNHNAVGGAYKCVAGLTARGHTASEAHGSLRNLGLLSKKSFPASTN